MVTTHCSTAGDSTRCPPPATPATVTLVPCTATPTSPPSYLTLLLPPPALTVLHDTTAPLCHHPGQSDEVIHYKHFTKYRTKTHAAATQTMERTRRRYTDQSRYKRKMPSHSYSSSTRTSAKSTPKHHVSTSTSPITLDPGYLTQFGDCGECLAHHCSCLNHIISGQRGDTTGDSSVATAPLPPPTTAPVSALTTCHLHPCSRPVQPVSHQDQCSGASMNKMSVVDILDDLKCSNNGPDTRRQDTLTRPVSSLAVSCPRAPCIRYDKLKSLSVNVVQNY